jgi:hypothetical protein
MRQRKAHIMSEWSCDAMASHVPTNSIQRDTLRLRADAMLSTAVFGLPLFKARTNARSPASLKPKISSARPQYQTVRRTLFRMQKVCSSVQQREEYATGFAVCHEIAKADVLSTDDDCPGSHDGPAHGSNGLRGINMLRAKSRQWRWHRMQD